MNFWIGYIARLSVFLAVIVPVIFVSRTLYSFWLNRWGFRQSPGQRRWIAINIILLSWLPLGLFALSGAIQGIYHATPVTDRILIAVAMPIPIAWFVGIWIFESSFSKRP